MSGQQASVARFREGAHRGVEALFGSDLQGLHLTPNGFER